jgi:hypothetical protein
MATSYSDFKKKSDNKESQYTSYTSFKNPQPSKAFPAAKTIGKGFLDMFNNPSEAQRSYERQVLPQYNPTKSKIINTLGVPGTAVARGMQKTFSRLIAPSILDVGSDLAQDHEIRRKGGIADKVESGELPPEVLQDFSTFQKSGYQRLGDLGQSFLEVATPGVGATAVKTGVKLGTKAAFKQGFKELAPIGTLSGGFQIMSEGGEPLKGKNSFEIAKDLSIKIGVSTFTMGVFGGILGGTIPATRALQNEVSNFLSIKNLSKRDIEMIASMRKVPVQGDDVANKIGIKTPTTKHTAYSKRQGYEPYNQGEELPTIDFGKTNKPNEGPIIDFKTGLPRKKTPEPIDTGDYIDFDTGIPRKKTPEPSAKNVVAIPEPQSPIIKPKPRVFVPQTNKQQVKNLSKKTDDELVDVLEGRAPSEDNLPPTAYLSELKNRATDQAAKGDMNLTDRIKNSDVGSLSGQDLQANKIAQSDNIVDMVRNIEKKMEEKMPKATQATKDKFITDTISKMKEAFSGFKPKRSLIREVLDVITCK